MDSASMSEEVGRLFLQCMMQRAALPVEEAMALYRRTVSVCEGHADLSDFPNFVSLLNRQLKPLGMELARGTMEDTGQKWYGLVNRSDDAAAKIATAYSPAELELFNKAMEMIVMGEDGTASSTALLRTVPTLERKLSHREAQEFLKSLVRDKWLKEELRGVFSPGPRFILELRPFLRGLFSDDIIDCRMCKEPSIQGQKCPEEQCGTKLHLYCAAKLFSGRSSIRCPGCHGDWPHPVPQIDSTHTEEALSTQASTSTAARSSSIGRKKSKGKMPA